MLDQDLMPKPLSEPNQAWMVTFIDLVSLMLTFFVLLFSMSNVKIDEWDKVTDSLSQSLKPVTEKTVNTPTAVFNIGSIFRKRAIDLDYLASVMEEAVDEDPLLKNSVLMRLEDRLLLALPGDLLFGPGRAALTKAAQTALFNLGGVLRNIGNQIGVNGHSDPTPPAGGAYASNWELSIARAVAVANTLKRSGYPDDIVAFGYSDTRFGQLPDVSPARRLALGRRVDIVVFPTAGPN